MKYISFIFVLFMFFTACLSGCTPLQDESEPQGPALEMANPASVYCQGLGFVEETREDELGQYGVCIFPDGSECDTWDFLAGRCGQDFSYCEQQGFELQSEEDQNIATCFFKDGSSCSEFLYFQGECRLGDG